MNAVAARKPANDSHFVLTVRPSHRQAGQRFRDGHRLPRTQHFVRQGTVPFAPRFDNETRRTFRFQVDACFGPGHRLAEKCQQRRTHRIAIQILPSMALVAIASDSMSSVAVSERPSSLMAPTLPDNRSAAR